MSIGIIFVLLNVIAIIFVWLLWKRKIKLWPIARSLFLLLYFVYLLSFIIIEGYILIHSHSAPIKQPSTIDYVVILGAGLRGTEPSATLEGRLVAALKFLQENDAIPVIVSGGQGDEEHISEAEAMALYLEKHGVDQNRIILEDRSTSTIENLSYTKELLIERGETDSTLLIVTSDYHLARAKWIAKSLGLSYFGLAGDSPFFVKVNYYFREYIGMFVTSYHLLRN